MATEVGLRAALHSSLSNVAQLIMHGINQVWLVLAKQQLLQWEAGRTHCCSSTIFFNNLTTSFRVIKKVLDSDNSGSYLLF